MFGKDLIRNFCNEYALDISKITNPFFLSKTIDDVLFKLNPSEEGFITYKGTPVFIYINEAIYGSYNIFPPIKDKKFHFYHCGTIKKAVTERRQDRYAATQAKKSLFDMTCIDKKVVKRRLNPCQNCITESGVLCHLPERYKTHVIDKYERKVYDTKTFMDFIEKVRLNQGKVARNAQSSNVKKVGYTDDWKEISRKYRASKDYVCDICSLDMSGGYKHLCHCHHINGDKHDNSSLNLMCLCVECHSKQPKHEHLKIEVYQGRQLNALRRKQQLNPLLASLEHSRD